MSKKSRWCCICVSSICFTNWWGKLQRNSWHPPSPHAWRNIIEQKPRNCDILVPCIPITVMLPTFGEKNTVLHQQPMPFTDFLLLLPEALWERFFSPYILPFHLHTRDFSYSYWGDSVLIRWHVTASVSFNFTWYLLFKKMSMEIPLLTVVVMPSAQAFDGKQFHLPHIIHRRVFLFLLCLGLAGKCWQI